MSGVLTVESFAADVADRIPELARDSKTNNAELLARLTRQALTQLCARDDAEAAEWLGVHRTTISRLTNLAASNPRRIRRTSYGKIPLFELRRHLESELKS